MQSEDGAGTGRAAQGHSGSTGARGHSGPAKVHSLSPRPRDARDSNRGLGPRPQEAPILSKEPDPGRGLTLGGQGGTEAVGPLQDGANFLDFPPPRSPLSLCPWFRPSFP